MGLRLSSKIPNLIKSVPFLMRLSSRKAGTGNAHATLLGTEWGEGLVRCWHSFPCSQQSWASGSQRELRRRWVAPTKHPWPWGK